MHVHVHVENVSQVLPAQCWAMQAQFYVLYVHSSLKCRLGHAEHCQAAQAQPAERADDTATASTSDTSITHRVWLDVALCDAPTPQDRRLGDEGVCKLMNPAGRIVLGERQCHGVRVITV